jgi:hypothetical protein
VWESEQPQSTTSITNTKATEVPSDWRTLESVRRRAVNRSVPACPAPRGTFANTGPCRTQRTQGLILHCDVPVPISPESVHMLCPDGLGAESTHRVSLPVRGCVNARSDPRFTRRRPRAATGRRRRTHRAAAMSHSPSKTSTPSSRACEPAAPNSSASWSATSTATGSATSAVPRGSSSSWQSRSADGPRDRWPRRCLSPSAEAGFARRSLNCAGSAST